MKSPRASATRARRCAATAEGWSWPAYAERLTFARNTGENRTRSSRRRGTEARGSALHGSAVIDERGRRGGASGAAAAPCR